MNSQLIISYEFLLYTINVFCYCSAWNEEAPFSFPPHLRDQHSTFEGLRTTAGAATLSDGNSPLEGVAINSAEADNLLS